MSTFLDHNEIATLTGRTQKSKQIEHLRSRGIAYYVDATGHPVVLRSVIEGRASAPASTKGWTPNVLRSA